MLHILVADDMPLQVRMLQESIRQMRPQDEVVTAQNGEEAVEQSYAKGETDEFVQPTVVLENGGPVACIRPQDSVVFYNFRPDRARQLTRAFSESSRWIWCSPTSACRAWTAWSCWGTSGAWRHARR